MDEDQDDEDDDMMDSNQALSQRIPTVHSSDAIDYSDFDETVPDDPMFSDKYYRRGMGIVKQNSTLQRSRLSLVSDNYEEEDEEEDEEHSSPASLPAPPSSLHTPPSLQSSQLTSALIFTPKSIPSFPTDTTQKADQLLSKVNIKELFPGFEKGKVLKFSDLFNTKIKRPPKLHPNKKSNSCNIIIIILKKRKKKKKDLI